MARTRSRSTLFRATLSAGAEAAAADGPTSGSGLLLEGDAAADATDFLILEGDASGFLLLEGDAA